MNENEQVPSPGEGGWGRACERGDLASETWRMRGFPRSEHRMSTPGSDLRWEGVWGVKEARDLCVWSTDGKGGNSDRTGENRRSRIGQCKELKLCSQYDRKSLEDFKL